jgi:hypothetical protein
MVRGLWLLGLLLATGSAFGAQLGATLDRRESVLGQPLQLRLEARGLATLEDVDLSALADRFEVFAVTQAGEGEGRSARARLDATLYPLREGVFTIPPLRAGQLVSKPVEVEVKPDPDITLRTRFVQTQLHERLQTLLVVEIRDRADRQWTRPARLEIPGLLLRPLPETQREETEESAEGPRRITVREFRWAALALKAGHYAAKLPMLDAYQLGTRLRLPLPDAVLSVSALPAWLPVAVPVGKPVLEVQSAPQQATVGEPFQWTLRIVAEGITAEGMKRLLRLPEGEQNGLRFYTAQYGAEEDKETGRDVLAVVVPVLPARAGEPHLPAVTLPWFDPHTQRLEQVRVEAVGVAVSDPFWRRLALIAAALAAAGAAAFAFRQGRRLWRRREERAAALRRVAGAGDAWQLAQAVCSFSKAPHPGTLRQWLSRSADTQSCARLVEELEQACYGTQAGHDLAGLKQGWIAALGRCPLS